MKRFYSTKWGNIFLLYINNSTTNKISNIFLTVVDIVIYTGGNNGNIHRSLKHCIQNFKTSLENIGIQNQYILYLEQKKFNGRKSHSTE